VRGQQRFAQTSATYREQLRVSGDELRRHVGCRLPAELANALANMTQSLVHAAISRNGLAYEDMLKCLLADSMNFPQYPPKELDLIAEFLGLMMMRFAIVPPGPLHSSVLNCIIAALRSHKSSPIFKFAIRALDQFKSRLTDFPLLVEELDRHRPQKESQAAEGSSVAYVCKVPPCAPAVPTVAWSTPAVPGPQRFVIAPLPGRTERPPCLVPMYVCTAWVPEQQQQQQQQQLQPTAVAGRSGRPPEPWPAAPAPMRTPGTCVTPSWPQPATNGGVQQTTTTGKAPGAGNRKSKAQAKKAQQKGHKASAQQSKHNNAKTALVPEAIQDLWALRAAVEKENEMKLELMPKRSPPTTYFVAIDDASMVLTLSAADLEVVPQRAPSPSEPRGAPDDDAETVRLLEVCGWGSRRES